MGVFQNGDKVCPKISGGKELKAEFLWHLSDDMPEEIACMSEILYFMVRVSPYNNIIQGYFLG